MSSTGKFSLGLVFLLIAGAQMQAQWNPTSDNPLQPSGMGCREIAVVVTDATGSAIAGADVETEDSAFNMTTDSRGVAAIPCYSVDRVMPILAVAASGFQTARVTLIPDVRGRFDVRLDRRQSVVRPSGATVNVSELPGSIQKQSAQLQQQAEKLLAAKDYDAAEKLLLDALHLTPSEANIANNLGVIALHKHDLENAGSWLQKAAEEAPYKPNILGNLGLVRWMQHQNKESYEILVKAFSRGYESPLGHYILGTIGLLNGNGKEAVNHLKRVPMEHFPYRDLYLSIALRNCGKTKAAEESYQSFIRHNPAPFLISALR